MAKARRLLVVVAGLAACALVSSSQSHGDPADKDRPNLVPVGPKAPIIQGNKNIDIELAKSRFEVANTFTYQPLEGDPYFALKIQPDADTVKADEKPRERDYLIMISTAATQAGPARLAALQITEAVIKTAGAEDKISLWEVNMPEVTKCHTGDFLDAKDAKLDEALTHFKKKAWPGGASDLNKGLREAIKSFGGAGYRQRIVLYLGDGLSAGNEMTAADRRALCEEMTKRRITFFPVPLGTALSPENLHGLATGTGGMVLRTQLADKLEDALKGYQAAFATPVLYPTKLVMPADVTEYYPAKLPPLRTDAPTLVIGRVKAGSKEIGYKVDAAVAGREAPVTLTLSEKLTEPMLDNYFLMNMA